MLSREQCDIIHRASLEILWRTGVRVYHKEALDLLRQAEAMVSDDNNVSGPHPEPETSSDCENPCPWLSWNGCERQYELLQEYAQEVGKPLSVVIREVVEQSLLVDLEQRRKQRALEWLCSQELPVDDWKVMERQIESQWEECGRGRITLDRFF